MAEQTQSAPTGMTDGRARTLGRRWLAATVVAAVAYVAVDRLGFEDLRGPMWLLVALFLGRWTYWLGWRDGAREASDG